MNILSDNRVILALVIIFAPVLGALIQGLDRKITARIQGRIGPPVMQPIYDIFKLLAKSPIAVNKAQILYAYLHLAFMILTLLLILMGQDALMILFVLAFSTLALVIGGMCVRSPYSRIGSQREIMLMVAYEPILILLVVGIYKLTGSFRVDSLLAQSEPLMLGLPLVFIAFLAVMAIKLQKSPFDLATSHHMHQELVKGITIEYSGPFLAIIEIAHCYEVAILFTVLSLFWLTNIWIILALDVAAFMLMIIIDNAFARLTTMWMFKFMWTIVLGLALTNIIWLYMR